MTSKIPVRLLCLLLCAAVLLPCVTAAGEETTKVAAYLLRLREKPSFDAKVLDSYKRGTVVTILKKGTEWTKVRVHGKTGYMQTDKLSYAKYKTAEERETIINTRSTNKNISTGTTAYVMKGVRLNLRTEPSNEGDIINSFRGGTKVSVLKKGKYWSLVEVKGYEGYMANEFLTSEKE